MFLSKQPNPRAAATLALSVAVALLWAKPFKAAPEQPILQFADRPVLVHCDLANAPCFRLKFNIVGSGGAPVAVELPAGDQLARSLTVHVGGKDVTPFFVSADNASPEGAVRPRVAMILIDISGSMRTLLPNGQTRFEAAKAATALFLNGFENGVDRVAIAPFGSHNVERTIRSAHFATTQAEAEAQINALPAPPSKENTGLFSAVSFALDVLAAESHSVAGSPEIMLLVMTDGQNDVQRNDDPGLLAGESGLAAVAAKVQREGMAVHTIGFGNRRDIDEAALQRIGTKFDMAEDPEDLKRLFTVSRALLNSRMRATLESPWKDRASLAGKDLTFTADLRLAGGEVLHSGQVTWSTPEMGVPAFEDKCDAMEARALLVRPKPPDTTGWVGVAILRPILVFVAFGVMLIALWFGLPRLIWPDRYETHDVALRPDRWVASTQVKESSRRRKAPAGFEQTSALMRGAGEKTVLRPRTDFSSTRSRLD